MKSTVITAANIKLTLEMYCPKAARIFCHCAALLLAAVVLSFQSAFAAPVTADQAAATVKGWLQQDHHPFGKAMSTKIKRAETVRNAADSPVYYVVHLAPTGFVVLPADDTADPIIAFSATGDLDRKSVV